MVKGPSKIVCVGRNYVAHARELGNEPPKAPLLFLKPPSALRADGEPILLPPASERVDYEGEIGVVVARTLSAASEEEAVAAIAGYVPANDVTARDLQRKDDQWTRAKGFDTFCPVGPLLPATEADWRDLEVVTRVNGMERQRGNAREMVFSIPTLLVYISAIMTLEPGDLVLTGTPEGVGPLTPGDVVEVEIGGRARVSSPVATRQP